MNTEHAQYQNEGHLIRIPFWIYGFNDLPSVPFSLRETIATTVRLFLRLQQMNQALNGLQNVYTIDGQTSTGNGFLFGTGGTDVIAKAQKNLHYRLQELTGAKALDHANGLPEAKDLLHLFESQAEGLPRDLQNIQALSLTDPTQFGMGWTEFAEVNQNAQDRLAEFASTLEVSEAGAQAATESFWPMIAKYGMAFNLLLPKKVGAHQYQIDLTLFESLEANQEGSSDFWRFTPACLILLDQDPVTKNLIPTSIQVSNFNGADDRTFIRGDAGTSTAGWMYALQAAKTAVTVYGIWLGHVYHWHIVTGALQMTMYQQLAADHPIRTFLDPMSKFLIGFDDLLYLTFPFIAPPTSVPSGKKWMELENTFAKGRSFFDDDPKETLTQLNIQEADFTVEEPWDQYIIVRYLLQLWDASETYVQTYVDATWTDGQAVVDDASLQTWIEKTGETGPGWEAGNVRGLPSLSDPGTAKENLTRILSSYVYRITAHGCSRMNTAANPVLSFVANYPPTLQKQDLPPTDVELSTEELLAYLPKTGTIGSMITFLFIFIFSPPYESLIPATGIDQELFFPDGTSNPLNQALIDFRKAVGEVIATYAADMPTKSQWPRNIET